MKKTSILFLLTSTILASTNVVAADNFLVAVCATGLSLFAKDTNRVNAALAKADNIQIARQLAANRVDQIEIGPNGRFTERTLKQLMMDHDRACEAIGVRSAIR